MNPDKELRAVRWVVFGSALLLGAIFGSIIGSLLSSKIFGCFAVLLFSVVHPIVGAHAIPICEKLRVIAFPDSPAWGQGDRALVGAFWPFTLAFWGIMALYFGIINHYYRF